MYVDLNRVEEMDDQRFDEDLYLIEYDNQDHRDKVEFPNVNNDPAGSLVQIRVHHDDGNLECVYSSQPGTQQTTSTKYRTVELGGKKTKYEYDDIKRLTNATTTLDDQASSQVRRFQYAYDRHSNLVGEQATGTTPHQRRRCRPTADPHPGPESGLLRAGGRARGIALALVSEDLKLIRSIRHRKG